MKADELTKEQVEAMSDAEVRFWCQQFAEQEQAANMRKHMMDQVEIREAQGGPRIHVESTVVD